MLQTISNSLLLLFVIGIPVYGTCKKINVFDAFIEGAKQGFETTITLLPYLVGMLIAIGMLRASGFFELLSTWLAPLLSKIGMPCDLLPLAMIRPFSGSAATAMMANIMHDHGGDSLVSKMAATMMGSTETTFYVIAVYFGAINIRRTRYAIPAGLIADLSGIIASVMICNYLFS